WTRVRDQIRRGECAQTFALLQTRFPDIHGDARRVIGRADDLNRIVPPVDPIVRAVAVFDAASAAVPARAFAVPVADTDHIVPISVSLRVSVFKRCNSEQSQYKNKSFSHEHLL